MNNQTAVFPKLKRWTFNAALFAFVSLPALSFAQNTPQGVGTAPIADVAKKATPAVVSVNVKMATGQSSPYSFGGRYQHEAPFDFFSDPFFQDFFGSPRGRRAPRQQFQTGQASGFVVSQDGYILTNAHVVKNADEIRVTFNDGKEFLGEVVGSDPNTDVAVIKIEANNLPYLTLGNTDNLEVGQWVVAIGNPLGLQASVTAGVVSAKGRNNLALARVEDFIQTDAAINRGNSGGPLLNLNGEVIGMNTAIVTNRGSGGYMGIGFAIPSNILQHIMSELIEKGNVSRGFMGVTLQQIDHDLALAFDLDKAEGALIAEVSKKSPAEKAGLKPGDIILGYNGKKVSSTHALRTAVSLMKPGTELKLTILREGQKTTVPLIVGTYPGDEPLSADPLPINRLGIEVETLDDRIGKDFGYQGLTGAIVTSVQSGSPAAWAGLQPGILIVAVNHKEIASADQFYQELRKADPARPILLLVRQGDFMHFISIKTG